jgi:hypothetical protein
MMRRSWRAGTLAAALALVGVALVSACASEGGPPSAAGGQDQAAFVRSYLADREFLFDGYAATVSSVRVPVDDTYRLTVRVCGDRAGCVAAQTGSPSAPPSASPAASGSPDTSGTPGTTPSSGTTASPGTPATPTETPPASEPPTPPAPGEAVVRVGGLVSTRLTSNMPGSIAPLGSAVQPVLTPDDRAVWQWDLTPSRSGSYLLQVHVSVLRAETNQPLIADQVIEIPLTVEQTAAKTAERAWFGIKEVVGVLSAAGVSLVAVVGFFVRWLVKRRRRARAAEKMPVDVP